MSKTFAQDKLGKTSAKQKLDSVIRRYLEDLDTPRSLTVWLLYKYNEHDQLVDLRCDPFDYGFSKRSFIDDIDKFKYDYAATNLLSKADFLQTSFDKTQRAFDKFIESEAKCRVTNERLSCISEQDRLEKRSWSRYLLVAQNKISQILGDVPSLNSLDYAFGPGASSTCCGNATTIGHKLQSQISVTCGGRELLEEIGNLPHLFAAAFDIENIEGPFCPTGQVHIEFGNKLTFVPKNSKIDRAICVEPHTNIFLQKGIGKYIRQRLTRFGLDLDNQASMNASFAAQGSIDGNYATIDLSSASDTISNFLVLELLPLPWFELLDKARSHYTQLPNGDWIYNEKFSSMGNGFTFELESLIFWSLSEAVRLVDNPSCGKTMTFGDDIIVPTEIANRLIGLLEFLGFSTNAEKTYTHGFFRESCGHDYLYGINVRPFFIKELPLYETDFFKIANGIRHIASRFTFGTPFCDRRLYRAWSAAVSIISVGNRLFGPKIFGDQVIWNDRRSSAGYWTSWFFTLQTKILVRIPRSTNLQRFTGPTQRAVSLTQTVDSKGGVGETSLPCRGESNRFRVKSVTIPCNWEWDEGVWIL